MRRDFIRSKGREKRAAVKPAMQEAPIWVVFLVRVGSLLMEPTNSWGGGKRGG